MVAGFRIEAVQARSLAGVIIARSPGGGKAEEKNMLHHRDCLPGQPVRVESAV